MNMGKTFAAVCVLPRGGVENGGPSVNEDLGLRIRGDVRKEAVRKWIGVRHVGQHTQSGPGRLSAQRERECWRYTRFWQRTVRPRCVREEEDASIRARRLPGNISHLTYSFAAVGISSRALHPWSSAATCMPFPSRLTARRGGIPLMRWSQRRSARRCS